MKPIGGEIALKKTPYQSFFTDSGRSSLRLFFRSEDYRNKKVLLPDFFCGIIEQILIEEKVSYDFYTVKNDFTIDYNDINSSTFDILYVINYFGKITSLKQINLKNKILLEDNVFLIHFKNRHKAKQWFGFNSFRKITSLSDGSLIKTNLKINQTLINPINANFVEAKVKASLIKFQFLKMKEYSEKEYLELFKKGEEEIDMQNNIYTISPKSLYLLESIHFKKLNKIAKKDFINLKNILLQQIKIQKIIHFLLLT